MLEVAAAILSDAFGRVLIARRKPHKAQGGYWEFPGGKLESGESVEACLRRELLEEMNLVIDQVERFGIHEHDYGTVHIRLIACLAVISEGEIQLTDHDAYRWVAVEELNHYDLAPADLPFVRMLEDKVRG
ncbi:(deoxy)nucleoside triphosphate pyrophosphohydrolase [Paenibacillus daejeonensis]|uniref:(deoxy)nucleoside triphosphate pyrophosphohydrolase n=1 Tax=Paenibacillus daejeonensis TaxID=135193 RepID=UPI00036CE9CB|nr:(deoxy)nucleoside triphosphate pyrophosphohydrolase [Paenibacillus daejeonensis]